MKRSKKIWLWSLSTLVGLYIIFALYYYSAQEKMIFPDTKLPPNYTYQFTGKFQELNVQCSDGARLNGLLFKSDSSKGVIFYLHGISGNLSKWGKIAKVYTDLNYDIFFLDYRGYGKSEGEPKNEEQIYGDVQAAYNKLKTIYREKNIVLFGYSFGTGPAAKLAADNNPKMLVLQAPYYSLLELGKDIHPVLTFLLPTFFFKYKLKTYESIEHTKAPVIIFHGDNDRTINIDHSYRLKKHFQSGNDTLIVFKGQDHNGFTENPVYLSELKRVIH